MNKSLTIMVGIPGSGKSTMAFNLFYGFDHSEPNEYVTIVCPDDIRRELSGDANDQSVSGKAFDIAYERVKQAFIDNKSVIFDAVCVNARTRKQLIKIADTYDADVHYFIIATKYEKALERNNSRDRKVPEHVIKNFFDRFCEQFHFTVEDRRKD